MGGSQGEATAKCRPQRYKSICWHSQTILGHFPCHFIGRLPQCSVCLPSIIYIFLARSISHKGCQTRLLFHISADILILDG